MAFETTIASIADLNESWPLFDDDEGEGDDHLRLLKKAVRLLRLGVPGAAPSTSPALDSSGTITVSSSLMYVQPATGATGGTLNFVLPGDIYLDGMIFILAANPSKPIRVAHATAGAEHIELKGAADFILNKAGMFVALSRRNGYWTEVFRQLETLGNASTRDVGTDDANLLQTSDADLRYALLDAALNTLIDSVTDLPVLKLSRTDGATPASGGMQAISSKFQVGSLNNVPLGFLTNGGERAQIAVDQGFFMTGATGSSQGAGTMNAQGIFTNGLKHSEVLISEVTLASVANSDITLPSSGYRMLRILLDDFGPATDGVDLQALFSFNGSTFPTTNYEASIDMMRSSGGSTQTNSTTEIMISHPGVNLSNAAAYALNAELFIPRLDAARCQQIWGTVAYGNASLHGHARLGGHYATGGSVAVKLRLLMSSGNIARGRISLFGVL